MSSKTWDGNAMTQNDMMLKDTVIVLDFEDKIIGSESKKDSHVFSTKQPHGVLHRAFSVFLFNSSTNELLLQKRASTKITFPNVWTNTCCSHPLHGMEPNEVDTPEDVANGTTMGVKHAAIRKLNHELGIPTEQLTPYLSQNNRFKFITRLHYWAADTITHGKKTSPWGEHEIDYVLFLIVDDKQSLTFQPHPDEVDDIKWVSSKELVTMMNNTKELLFSPWFRIICNKWLLSTWWDNLDTIMNTSKFCDYTNIFEFDPPEEHLGGAGNAKPLFKNGTTQQLPVGDATKKQGAYGKIQTHSESKLKQILHIDEVFAAITCLYIKPLKSNLDTEYNKTNFNKDDLKFCDDILVNVSRSFAAVIRQLPSTMVVDILIFYLVLRALDTIEDDTQAFQENIQEKIKHLQQFSKTALSSDHPDWKMDGVGEGDEKRLLQNFPIAFRVFSGLQIQSQRIITDIAHRMAVGMAEFVTKDLGQGTTTIVQYNRYCHFVAGLVGEGLTRIFAASGYEKPSFASELYLSDQMGLFLQKTNIIRDYLEDYVDGRAFWPQEVWKKYSQNGDLGYFALQSTTANTTNSNHEFDLKQVQTNSLYCLNELITDALELIPDLMIYMSKLQCAEIFRFCAIPQVMAIATLDKCYCNLDVFTGVVKIRKGLSCKLILKTNTIDEVHETFYEFTRSIMKKAEKARTADSKFLDPNYDRTIKVCETVCDATYEGYKRQRWNKIYKTWVAPIALAATSFASIAVLDKLKIGNGTTNTATKRNGSIVVFAGVLFFYVLTPKQTSALKPAE